MCLEIHGVEGVGSGGGNSPVSPQVVDSSQDRSVKGADLPGVQPDLRDLVNDKSWRPSVAVPARVPTSSPIGTDPPISGSTSPIPPPPLRITTTPSRSDVLCVPAIAFQQRFCFKIKINIFPETLILLMV